MKTLNVILVVFFCWIPFKTIHAQGQEKDIEVQEKHISDMIIEALDKMLEEMNEPCSDSTFIVPRQFHNGWDIVSLPKINESETCNELLAKEVNDDISRTHFLKRIDIQYSREKGCIPEIFMISEVSRNPILSTGHLSCFNVSVCAGDESRTKYCFNQHVDAGQIKKNQRLDSLYKETLKDRLISLRDSANSDSIEVIIGASNVSRTRRPEHYQYVSEINYLTNAIEEIGLFKYTLSWFCSGPNVVMLTLEEIMEIGGVDRYTTDVMVFPSIKKIYIIRPINPPLFDEVFESAEEQMKKYEQYFESNTPVYVYKLSDLHTISEEAK